MDYEEGTPEHFKGDPLRIQQVLTNLIGNAIKFTEAGSVKLRIFRSGEMIGIEVADTGIGMSPSQLTRIFDPFSQADASISRRFGGTGLGTTIAHQLTQLMGGSISVDSTLGHGSVFNIALPLKPGAKPSHQSGAIKVGQLPKLRILAADDVPQNLELLAFLFEEAGHEITLARDGEEAVRLYSDFNYDVILMDVHMPKVDGLEASGRIRAEEKRRGWPATPIIALTASVMESDRKAAVDAGMDGFASKPFDMPKLKNEIARVLNLTSESHLVDHFSEDRNMVIDWERCEILWGNRVRAAKAITRFLVEQTSRYGLPDADLPFDADSWHKTSETLHSLRGVAANLGLVAVAKTCSLLEQEGNNPVGAWQALLQQLKAQLAVVKSQLPDDEPDMPEATHPRRISVSEVIQALAKLSSHLQHGELDDDSVEKIGQWLVDNDQVALRNDIQDAIESFEFDRACDYLKQVYMAASGTPASA